MIKAIWENEPDFVNEEGVKWWIDKLSTNFAQKPDIHGTTLENYIVYLVEFPDNKMKTYVIVDNDKGEVVFESQKLEDIGIHIDVRKLLKRDPNDSNPRRKSKNRKKLTS